LSPKSSKNPDFQPFHPNLEEHRRSFEVLCKKKFTLQLHPDMKTTFNPLRVLWAGSMVIGLLTFSSCEKENIKPFGHCQDKKEKADSNVGSSEKSELSIVGPFVPVQHPKQKQASTL
jgi:hypothetical protein